MIDVALTHPVLSWLLCSVAGTLLLWLFTFVLYGDWQSPIALLREGLGEENDKRWYLAALLLSGPIILIMMGIVWLVFLEVRSQGNGWRQKCS